MLPRRRRVFLYLTRGDALLVLRHVHHPELRLRVECRRTRAAGRAMHDPDTLHW